MKVIKTLYGIPEPGLHWYLTYIDYHIRRLQMKKSKGESCLLMHKGANGSTGLAMLQVDDKFYFGDRQFTANEERPYREFLTKPR